MEKELVEIVLQKSFIELSKDERIALLEWCTSEEEYDQMKNVFLEVERMKAKQTATVRPDTKKSLDAIFNKKHHKTPVFWNNSVMTLIYPLEKPLHKRPLIQVAAVALLFLFTYPIINQDNVNPAVQMAKNEVKRTEIKKEVNSGQNSPSITVSTTKNPDNSNLKEAKSIEDHPTLVAITEVTISGVEIADNLSSVNTGVSHPDGVFEGEINSVFSEPVSEDPDVLDLLTVTF